MPVTPHKFKLSLHPVFWLALCCAAAVGCAGADTAGKSSSPTQSASPVEPAAPVEQADDRPIIVAFGDSLTAGYGLAESQSYPALLQQRLDEKGLRYRVVNAGISGDTSAGGVRRIDWALAGEVKFMILELGANDALRGQAVAAMKKNLSQIIVRAQSRNMTVVLAGMEAPPNYGDDYTREFRRAFQDLAQQHKLKLIPFFLAGVGGRAELNQADGIHPNTAGTKIVADNVWRVLQPLL